MSPQQQSAPIRHTEALRPRRQGPSSPASGPARRAGAICGGGSRTSPYAAASPRATPPSSSPSRAAAGKGRTSARSPHIHAPTLARAARPVPRATAATQWRAGLRQPRGVAGMVAPAGRRQGTRHRRLCCDSRKEFLRAARCRDRRRPPGGRASRQAQAGVRGGTVPSNFARVKKVLFDLRAVAFQSLTGPATLQPPASTAATGDATDMCAAVSGVGQGGEPGWQGSPRGCSPAPADALSPSPTRRSGRGPGGRGAAPGGR